MMKNTKENRLKFYALHLGQKMIIDSDCFRSENRNDIINTTLISVSLKGIECDSWIPETEHTSLKLKPLSSITDKDLRAIGFTFSPNTKVDINFSVDSYFQHWTLSNGSSGYLTLKDFDYLRSQGYALPWLGLSVENMVQYGWIKLKK